VLKVQTFRNDGRSGGDKFFYCLSPCSVDSISQLVRVAECPTLFFLHVCAQLTLMRSGGHKVGKVYIILVHTMKAYGELRHS
jgi:hypothetical protein